MTGPLQKQTEICKATKLSGLSRKNEQSLNTCSNAILMYVQAKTDTSCTHHISYTLNVWAGLDTAMQHVWLPMPHSEHAAMFILNLFCLVILNPLAEILSTICIGPRRQTHALCVRQVPCKLTSKWLVRLLMRNMTLCSDS